MRYEHPSGHVLRVNLHSAKYGAVPNKHCETRCGVLSRVVFRSCNSFPVNCFIPNLNNAVSTDELDKCSGYSASYRLRFSCQPRKFKFIT